MKTIHFIGIAGSAIAPIAIMMREKGFRVTGSDDNVYEPALSLLNSHGIEWQEGYEPNKQIEEADLVIIGGAPLMKDPNNPQFHEAQRLNKPVYGYDHILQEYVVKPESIVVTGSYGKTTTTSLLNWIFECAGHNPSFMIGGKPANFDTGVRSTESQYSILEGDEYLSVFGFDTEPRFTHYKPKYAVISAAKWDHVNVYKTEQSYVDAFKKLTVLVGQNKGVIFACSSGENVEELMKSFEEKVVTYCLKEKLEDSYTAKPDFVAEISGTSAEGFAFTVSKNGQHYADFITTMIGRHNIENCLAAITLADYFGISIEIVKKAFASFKGVRRRQEIRGRMTNGAMVIDDFAHSPVKAQSTLDAVRESYPKSKIIAIYFPRASARESRQELPWYKGAFDKADHVVIPQIKVKRSTPKEDRVYGRDIVEAIKASQPNAHYIPRDEDIIDFIQTNSRSNSIILFMSAGGWRGMVEKLVNP